MTESRPEEQRDEAASSTSGGSTVRITVQILELLARSHEPLRMSEIARTLGMSKTKVFRHLATLRELDFVRSAREGERLMLGPRLIFLGRRASEQIGLGDVAAPHLTTLRNSINMSVGLAIPHGRDVMIILSVSSLDPASITIREGEVLQWPRSPSTQVLTALDDEAVWSAEIDSLTLPAKERAQLKAALRRAATERYRVEFDALGDGLAAVAVPIVGSGGEGIGAIFAVTTSPMLSDPVNDQILSPMLDCASEIGRELGVRAR